jgi:hypothetical protein
MTGCVSVSDLRPALLAAVRLSDGRDPPLLSGQGPMGRLAAVGGRGVAPLRPEFGVHDRCASGGRSDRARLDLGIGITTRISQGRKSLAIMPGSRKQFDVIAETSQFADHLARPHLLRFFADGWPAFFVPNPKSLPDQATESMRELHRWLCVSEARGDTASRVCAVDDSIAARWYAHCPSAWRKRPLTIRFP